jgi:hypothetical protein
MSRLGQIGRLAAAAAVLSLAACAGAQGKPGPLPAPTTIPGASASVVTVTQEGSGAALGRPESGVVVGFKGGRYLIATGYSFLIDSKLRSSVRISVPGTNGSAEASKYACTNDKHGGPVTWQLLAVPAADLGSLPVLKLGAWTAGPGWLAMSGYHPGGVQIIGRPVDPGRFAQNAWAALPGGPLIGFSPSIGQVDSRWQTVSPSEFAGAALLEQVSGGVRLVGLGEAVLGNPGNTIGAATDPSLINYLLQHPGHSCN